MAKLEGVKIIDAKGGVIEKISYDGAEYIAEKVPYLEFEVDDVMWFNDYEFTRINRIENKNGGICFWFDNSVMFVSMGEKELIKTRFRKVVTYNVGDWVRALGDGAGITEGKAYKVIDNTTSGYVRVFDDFGYKTGVAHGDIKPIKFNVGDIVVITGNTNDSQNKVGDIGKISDEVSPYSENPQVLVPGRSSQGTFTELSEMRHATPAEIAEYEKAEKPERPYEVGDIVRVVDSPYALPNGTLFEIKAVGDDFVTDGKYGYCTSEHIKPRVELVAPASARKDVKQ